MKTYIHPTINLPAGQVVVKFYDDLLPTASENTDNIIVSIGDTTEGFDFELGDLIVGSCEFELHNKNNYVLGTLLANNTLRISVTIDNKLYFYGEVDFETIDPGREDDPDINFKYSNIKFTANNTLAILKRVKVESIKNRLVMYGAGSGSAYYYIRDLFRSFAYWAKLYDGSTMAVEYLISRKWQFTDSVLGLQNKDLKDMLIDRYYFDVGEHENNYEENANNALEMLGLLAKDFFLCFQIRYDGTNFLLRVIEKDNGTTVTLPSIKKAKPSLRYLVRSLAFQLKNMREGMSTASLIYSYEKSSTYIGDDITIDNIHTNIERDYVGKTQHSGTLSSTQSLLELDDGSMFPNKGEAIIYSGSSSQLFSFEKKAATKTTAYGTLSVVGTTMNVGGTSNFPITGDAYILLQPTKTTSSGTLSTSGSTINVEDAHSFPISGNAYIKSGGTKKPFNFTGKTATSLTGCTIDSGTFDYASGSPVIPAATEKAFHYTGRTATTLTGCTIEGGTFNYASNSAVLPVGIDPISFDFLVDCKIPMGTFSYNTNDVVEPDKDVYKTNLRLYLKDSDGTVKIVTGVKNPGGTVYTSMHQAFIEAYKNIYYNYENWFEFTVYGLEASGDQDKLFPGYQFTYNGSTYLIHQVTKSLMKNESKVLALKIS